MPTSRVAFRCRGASRAAIRVAALAFALLGWTAPAASSELAEGDRHWRERAARLEGRLASPEPIEAAIAAYRSAARDGTHGLEPRWKLLRALHFLVEFTTASDERKDAAIEESITRSEAWLGEPAGDGAVAAGRARLHFWSAIAWGARGQRVGLWTIVREGVAGRIHESALRAVALDSGLERGGGYRLLSRLHADLPRVPFVTGWVDRDRALPLAEQAFAIAPDDAGNRLVLALALLESDGERRAEAIALLEDVTQGTPRPELQAEDLAIREEARERLDALDGDASEAAGAP